MVLVDTSVWVAHLRDGNIGLETLLNEGRVAGHPFVIGELACWNLKNRSEVMEFIEAHGLMGKGLGYIDMHLLASAILTEVSLWTLDRKLDAAASKLERKYLSA